jgi:hypothetical protein
MSRRHYKPGVWKALCDVCGFEFKSDKLKQRWDGMMVCSEDFETRHPQDLLRVPRENPSVPWTRPDNVQYATNFYLETENGDVLTFGNDNIPLTTR